MTIWPALDTKFAVCLGRAHGESGSFAVCLPSGHTANLGGLLCACRPGTRRTAADAVSWPWRSLPAFFRREFIYTHGEKVCRVPDFWHTANKVLPSPWLPSALCRRPPSAKSSPCAYVVSGCVHSFLAACEIYTTRMTVTFYWSIHVCVYVIVFLEIRHSWLYWWNWNLWNCNFCWWACSICPLNFLALFTTYKDVSMMFVGLDESAYIPVIGADNSWKWYWDIPIIRYWGMFIRRLLEMLCMWYWLTFFCSLYSGSTSSMCSASMQPSFLSDIYNHPNGFLTQMILTKKRNSIILVEQ